MKLVLVEVPPKRKVNSGPQLAKLNGQRSARTHGERSNLNRIKPIKKKSRS